MKCKALFLFLPALLLLLAGCASPRSNVYFSKPEATRVFLGNSETGRVMPIMLELPQTDDPGKVDVDEGGQPIRLEIPNGPKLKGFLYVYKSKLDQAEKLVLMNFELTDDRLEKLNAGQAVTVVGISSKGKPVYKVTLGIVK
jgi:hypothetical protein